MTPLKTDLLQSVKIFYVDEIYQKFEDKVVINLIKPNIDVEVVEVGWVQQSVTQH